MFTAHIIKAIVAIVVMILSTLFFLAMANVVGNILVVCAISTIIATYIAKA